jgi:N-carbamoyl-L-amino-acid hydrolase
MPAINAGRLLSDLRTLRTFGAVPDHPRGIIRPSFSPADMEAREWLRGKFEEAGLEASIDKHGIVFGRSKNPGPALLLGSHSDSQPRGGWLDGNLGVIYALEADSRLPERLQRIRRRPVWRSILRLGPTKRVRTWATSAAAPF